MSRLWHLTDMTSHADDVRSWGYGGHRGCVRARQLDQIGFVSDRGFPSGVLSPGRYSLTLGIPAQHNAEAIGGTANITRLGYIVEKIGTSEHILPHAVAQEFEVSSSGALVPATNGPTKPTYTQGLSIRVQISN
jgi:hypothetical protein